MMVPLTRNKKLKLAITYQEEVLFNSDTLSKIISYLPSVDLLNLAVTCKRLGSAFNDKQSIIETSIQIAIQDLATDEQLAALPHYEGESTLADYHYLQLLRAPLLFDQLVGAEYVNSGDKSCVRKPTGSYAFGWVTAFSNNILRAGKHYALFTPISNDKDIMVGVMRSGQSNSRVSGCPLFKQFYQNLSRRHGEPNNNVDCCMYNHYGNCLSSDWENDGFSNETWEGSEPLSSGDELGMLLDLDEGTLSVYKNGAQLGVMKRGLAGPYCWVITLYEREQFSIKRGTIPPRS